MENNQEKENAISNNLQYVRGNVRNWKHDEAKGFATFSVKVANESFPDEVTGEKPPKIKDSFIKVFVSGKVLDHILKNKLEENGPFVEASGEFEFKSYKDKAENNNTQNTMYAKSVKEAKFEKGVKTVFAQKYPNHIEMKGNLVADPELLNLEGGKKLVKVSLANNVSYKDTQGEWVEKVNFVELNAWDQRSEELAGLKKGDPILVTGYVNNTQKELGGVNRYFTHVGVSSAKLDLTVKKERDAKSEKSKEKSKPVEAATEKKKSKPRAMKR